MPKSAPTNAPSHGFAAYRRVLGAPHVLPLTLASMLARLPIGMGVVALILYVQEATGSFAAAGIVDGTYAIGLGITGPLLARVIDRRGAEVVIVPGGVLAALGLAGIVVLGHEGAGPAPLAALGLLAGAATPPVGGVMRQRMPQLVSAHDLPTVYAVDSIMIEAVFIVGPLLAGLLAALFGAGVALLGTAGMLVAGTLWFDLLSRNAPSQAEERRPTGWAGALGSPAMRVLVISGLPLGAVFGSLDVVFPAFGSIHGSSALSGPFMAALGVGSALGGIAYGARPHSLGVPTRAMFVLGLAQAATLLPILFVADVPEMFAASFLCGICVAPLVTVRNQLAQSRVLAGTGTEAFTWISLSVAIGASLGSALAGPIVQAAGWRAGAVLACAMPALSVLIALIGRDVFTDQERSEAVAA